MADVFIVGVFYEWGVVFVYILTRVSFLSLVSFLKMNTTGIVKLSTPGPCFTPFCVPEKVDVNKKNVNQDGIPIRNRGLAKVG